MSGFAADILPLLTAAGWTPDRHVELAGSTDGDELHPAFEALSALGGLHVGDCDSGIECARSDIEFVRIADQWKEIARWESWLGTRLVGIGHICHAHGQFYLDAAGRGFHFDRIGDPLLMFLGKTLSDSMRTLLLGIRGRPMLAPGQRSVEHYGDLYVRGDPAIYQWEHS